MQTINLIDMIASFEFNTTFEYFILKVYGKSKISRYELDYYSEKFQLMRHNFMQYWCNLDASNKVSFLNACKEYSNSTREQIREATTNYEVYDHNVEQNDEDNESENTNESEDDV